MKPVWFKYSKWIPYLHSIHLHTREVPLLHFILDTWAEIEIMYIKICVQTWNRFSYVFYRLLDSLVVECLLRVREVPGSIPSQGPRHTKEVIKMVPVVPLFNTEH